MNSNKVHITNLNNNLLKKSPSRSFLQRLNIIVGFKERSQKSLIALVVTGMVIVAGLGLLIFQSNNQNNLAQASKIQDDLLDSTFGESGQIPIPVVENKIFSNPKFLEYQNQTFGVATATDKSNSSLKTIAVFSLNNDGSLNTDFNLKGYNILSFKNQARVETVDFIIINDFIYILSKIDDCTFSANTSNCTASDAMVTKLDLKGQKIENYGQDGIAKFNLSENNEISNLGEKEDYPVSIIGFTGGRIAFLSSYHYQNKETFVTGFAVVYLNNKGLIDNTQGFDGIQKFNHRDYPILQENGDYSILNPMTLVNIERNSSRIEFTKGDNIYGEIILDSFGKIRKINSQDINLISADINLFAGNKVKLKARKSVSGKIIFYGSCNFKDTQWRSICVARYLYNGKIDTSFAVNTNNIFNLEYIGGDFVFEYGATNFIEDPVTQQIGLSIAVRINQNSKTINEIILLKPTGEFNPNFANKGIWRTASNFVSNNFLNSGKLIAYDNNVIYRLAKPLFIDPVITKINPNNSSTLGGLDVFIEGDNFIKSPLNPKFIDASSKLKIEDSQSVISNVITKTDTQNNIYITGNFSGKLIIQDKPYETTSSQKDIFLLKLNQNQEILWSKIVGGQNGDDTILNIALDDNENPYILASTNSDLSLFSGQPNGQAGQPNLVVSKLTKTGDISWVKRISGKISEIYSDLIVSANAVYISGNYSDNIKIDNNQISTRENQGFVASLDSVKGDLKWIQVINSESQTQTRKMQLVSATEIVVFGNTNGNIKIGFDTLKNEGLKDIFALKYNLDGNIVSGKIFGGNGIDEIDDALITKDGSLVISAELSYNPVSNIQETGGFYIVKLTPSYKVDWATTGRGLLKEDALGEIIAYGQYQDSILFGTNELKSKGETDNFASKIDKNGKVIWAKSWGGLELDTISDLYIDPDDNLYFTGNFKNSSNFNNILLTSLGDLDLYILKLNQNGDQVWVKQGGSKTQDSNLKFTGKLEKGNLKLFGLVGTSAVFDKLVIPGEASLNLATISIYDQDLSVYFGNKLATKLEVVDKNKLKVIVPPNIEGLVDIKILGYDSSETIFPNSFEYTTNIDINLNSNPNAGSGASRI